MFVPEEAILKLYGNDSNFSFCNNFCHFRDRKRIRVAGFATLRKKFIRKRRSSKAMDHGRVIREVVSDWSSLEVRFTFGSETS